MLGVTYDLEQMGLSTCLLSLCWFSGFPARMKDWPDCLFEAHTRRHSKADHVYRIPISQIGTNTERAAVVQA